MINEYPEKEKNLYAPKASIMVVDDNSMNLKVITKLLQATGIQIEAAESGSICLEKLGLKHYDIIFMDHMMPMMDGIEAFHRIREMDTCNKDVTVIALTANTDPNAREMYISEGFADYMLKPVKPEMLKALIVKYLNPDLFEDAPEPALTDGEHSQADHSQADYSQIENSLNNQKEQEELPYIEGLDWKVAESHFNDREIMWDTLRNFYITLTKEAGQLSILFNSLCVGEEITRYRICVHSMKSISRLVGLVELSDMAQKLEEAAESNNVKFIHDNHDGFVERWMSYRDKLKPFFEVANVYREINKNEFIGHLERLANASLMLEVDIMDSVAKALESYSLDWESGQEKLNNLLAAVVDLDTDTIATLTDELKLECMNEF